jgi:hypothetical protein
MAVLPVRVRAEGAAKEIEELCERPSPRFSPRWASARASSSPLSSTPEPPARTRG